jgi:hypothetical protein
LEQIACFATRFFCGLPQKNTSVSPTGCRHHANRRQLRLQVCYQARSEAECTSLSPTGCREFAFANSPAARRQGLKRKARFAAFYAANAPEDSRFPRRNLL